MIRELRPGGFWRRGAALGVDWLWLFCLGGSLTWILFGSPLGRGGAMWPDLGAQLIRDVLPAVVFIVGWRLYGTTPGKLLLELRVVDARTGERPSWGRAILRYVGYFLSALPLGLGFFWALIDRRNQTFHDKLAHTRVIVVEEAILPKPGAETPAGPREPAA